ncbi:hypothetical protein CHY_0142 [Carboxydothermus hydrogenoformans Z-2901]|uniref:Uncharacterized protein n=1 Tax=Carboxydothermus hydrogenoformans (strain ATCC BAA-161 / DSM 6008 / Z-2901) TaxID=246194 RepID=Q3AFS0_CARHZ|nr:hypothetical protein CHY_0142 [Carboxydothermus hydrogenoformans Z-2901]
MEIRKQKIIILTQKSVVVKGRLGKRRFFSF